MIDNYNASCAISIESYALVSLAERMVNRSSKIRLDRCFLRYVDVFVRTILRVFGCSRIYL